MTRQGATSRWITSLPVARRSRRRIRPTTRACIRTARAGAATAIANGCIAMEPSDSERRSRTRSGSGGPLGLHAEIVTLADGDAVVAQQRVGRRQVEIEVGDRVLDEIVGAGHP